MNARTRPTAHAGVVIAIVLGALPAATVGLDVAWVVVASGASALILGPVLARRQVRTIERVALPAQIVLHAGRTSTVRLDVDLASKARHVLVDLTRIDARPSERERAPRLAVESVAGALGAPVPIDAPVRMPTRGRLSALAVTFESTYPFGLFRSELRLTSPCDVVVLPRVLRRGNRALERALAELGSGDDLSSGRPVPRGPGLPAAFRPSRRDDTARDIAWRPSARRMRWISADRTPATLDRVTIVLVIGVRGARAASARRSRAAFEAAVSVCATAIDRLTRAGQEVTLRISNVDPDGAVESLGTGPSRVVSRSVRAFPHLLALTDVDAALEPEREDPERGADGRGADGRGGDARAESRPGARRPGSAQLVLVATAVTRGFDDTHPAPIAGAAVLAVDANGRSSLVGAPRAARRLAAAAR